MSHNGNTNDNSGSDTALQFADLLDDVRPLNREHRNRVAPHSPKLDPTPKETLKDHERVLRESLAVGLDTVDLQPGDSLSFRRSGIQKGTFGKLKRGGYSVGAELDLHGYTKREAQVMLAKFIQTSRENNVRCVRIIHGKGYGSNSHGPTIKPLVNEWLQQRNEILAFTSSRPRDGGTGAMYVLLKKLR